MLLYVVVEVFEYVAADGRSPYAKWFNNLNAQAAAKVTITVTRMAQGNFSNTKSVGAGFKSAALTPDLATEFILVGTATEL
jgi:hypothetical protein